MKEEIRVGNFRKSPSNIHHLIIDGDYKTLCGLSKNEDPGLWERQEKGDGLVCKSCQRTRYNLSKEQMRKDDCDCGDECGDECECNDCDDDCKCEAQVEIPFKEVAFVKKSGSKTQHMAIIGSHKTFCGLTRNISHLWKYQSLADDTLCKNCSKSFAKSNGSVEDFHCGCDDEDPPEEVGGDECVEKEEDSRHARILRKSAYGFPSALNDPMPYDMVKRRMDLQEQGFGLEEIKAIMYNEFFGMDLIRLEEDYDNESCDVEFEGTIIGSTTRTDESQPDESSDSDTDKSQPDESLGLNADDHKEMFDELNRLHQKGVLPIDVIRKLFGPDVDSNISKVDRFINLMQSVPKGKMTKEARQSGNEALEETFTEWKDGCISGKKKLLDHEFFYRVMKIQEILNKPRF